MKIDSYDRLCKRLERGLYYFLKQRGLVGSMKHRDKNEG